MEENGRYKRRREKERRRRRRRGGGCPLKDFFKIFLVIEVRRVTNNKRCGDNTYGTILMPQYFDIVGHVGKERGGDM